MGANANLAESKGRQKPAAQSKFRCLIIEIGRVSGFWRAALRITPHFCRLGDPPGSKPEAGRHFQSLPGLGSSGSGPLTGQQGCDFIPRSPDCVRLGASVAGLSHAISRGPAGGGPGRGRAGAGLDHHPCPERAGARRRIAAVGRAGGSRSPAPCSATARRSGPAIARNAKSSAPGRCLDIPA